MSGREVENPLPKQKLNALNSAQNAFIIRLAET